MIEFDYNSAVRWLTSPPHSKVTALVEIRLFGSLDIVVDGHPLPRLRSRKARWLVALLALRQGRPISREWLAQALWPDQEVDKAKAYLRQTLTEVRGALGADASCIEAPDPRHLLLSVHDVSVDLATFDALVSTDPVRAADLHLAPLLEGCDESWAVEARGLRESNLVEALLAIADTAPSSEAVKLYGRITSLDPYRERAQRGLMKALFEVGDDAAAIKTYREFKLLLHRDLNAEPAIETKALYLEMRRRIKARTAVPSLAEAPTAPLQVAALAQPASKLRSRLAIAFLAVAVPLALLALPGLGNAKPNYRALPIEQFPREVWKEAYGPNEREVGEVVLARWPEIERHAEKLSSNPTALAEFAAPLWRSAFVLNRGTQVASWLRGALNAKAPMPPKVEALAAAAVAFQGNIDTEILHMKDANLGKRAHEAALRSGDPWLIAHCLRARGFVERTSIDPDSMAEGALHYQQAYDAFARLGDERGLALVETCNATNGAGGNDITHFDHYRCAQFAVKGFRRWERIGNTWGMAFTAYQLRGHFDKLTDRGTKPQLCADAREFFRFQGSRTAADGNWQEALWFRAYEAITLVHLGKADEVAKIVTEMCRIRGEGYDLRPLWQYQAAPRDLKAQELLIKEILCIPRR